MKRELGILQGTNYRENPLVAARRLKSHSPYTSEALQRDMTTSNLVGSIMGNDFPSDVPALVVTENYTLLDHTNVQKPEHLFGRPLFLAVSAGSDKRAAYTIDTLNHFILKKWSEMSNEAKDGPIALSRMYENLHITFIGFLYYCTPLDRRSRTFSVVRHATAEVRMVLPKDPNLSGNHCLSFVFGMGDAGNLQKHLLSRGVEFGVFQTLPGECPMIYPVLEDKLVHHRKETDKWLVCTPVGEIQNIRTAYVRDAGKEMVAGAGVSDPYLASFEMFMHLSPRMLF